MGMDEDGGSHVDFTEAALGEIERNWRKMSLAQRKTSIDGVSAALLDSRGNTVLDVDPRGSRGYPEDGAGSDDPGYVP